MPNSIFSKQSARSGERALNGARVAAPSRSSPAFQRMHAETKSVPVQAGGQPRQRSVLMAQQEELERSKGVQAYSRRQFAASCPPPQR